MIPYFLSMRRLSAWVVVQALFLCQILSPFANAQEGPTTLKVEQGREGTVGPLLKAGLEEREVATPVDRAVPPTFQGGDLDSPERIRALMDALEAGYQQTGQGHVSVNHPVDRVAGWRDRQKGEGRLWEEIPAEVREPLQTLYDLRYDLLERPAEQTLDDPAVASVVGSSNSPHQAIADAARDVIMAVRARGLAGTLQRIAQEWQRQSGSFSPYARLSYTDALNTFIDPAFPGELGNPYRPLFDEHSLPPEAVHEALQFLFDPNSKKSWLKSFSGIRGPFTKAMIDGAMRRDEKGELRGFPVTDLQTDAATQLHDAAKVAVAHIVREFVQFALPMMAQKENWAGWQDGRKVSGPLRIGVLMDPRDTGPAVWQVVGRTLLKLGVEVEFAGIGSAPESAARALLSQGKVDSVIFISSSHVQQGTNGFKLMLKTGQILPVSEARAFIKHFIAKAKEPANTRELIGLLSDPADAPLNDRIAEIMREMPQAYLESKRLYGAYGDSVLAGVPMSEPTRVEERKRAIREQLARLKVIFLYDANGGSGVTDLAFLRSWAPLLITVNDRIRLFSHDLAPWEGSTAQAKAIAKKLEPELARRGYTLMVFGTDTDRDRRFMLPRNPHTREYYYPGPQALFSIDAIYHALTNAGKKPAVVGNDPTTARMELLAGAMGFRFEKEEVGEANVVAVLLQLVALGYKVMGGEGSNASTFGDEVLVRDLLLALGSAFAFMEDPELMRTLIRQVARPEEREPLLAQVEEWYRPENLPDLFYHVLEDVLPPEKVTDTFDPTEARRGTGTPATQAEIDAEVSRQKRYKDALDRVVEQEFLPGAIQGIARIIAEVSGEPVDPSQISTKIANYEGTERLEGFGNRKGHEGGYLLEFTYTDAEGQEHFLGWVWTRESQTEMGVARRIVDMVSDFLPREKGRVLVNQLYDFLYPKWNHTLDRAEMLAMESLLQELPPGSEEIRKLGRQAEETRGNNLEVRHDLESKYANPDKPENRSPNVEQNLRSELREVEGAVAEVRGLVVQLEAPVAEIRQIARTVLRTGRFEAEQAREIERQIVLLRQATEPVPAPAVPLSGEAELDRFGRDLVRQSARWVTGGAIGSLGNVSGATPQMLVEWSDRLARLFGPMREIARRPAGHYPQAHLVAADLHLAEQRARALGERVDPVPTRDRVLALELGGTFLRLGLVDRRTGQILAALPDHPFHFPYDPPRDWKNADTILWQIAGRVRELLENIGLSLEDVGSVSVSSPGDLIEETVGQTPQQQAGFITLQNNLPFTQVNLISAIREKLAQEERIMGGPPRFEGPVVLSNDMSTAVRAEILYGTAQGRKAAGYVTVSSGMNAAFYAPQGQAIDLGMWGYKAYDGRTAEEHTSGIHLARLAREAAQSPEADRSKRAARIVELAGGDPAKIEGKHVGQAFAEKDPLATELVENAARVLGTAVVEATGKLAEQKQLSDEPEVLWIFGGGVSVGIGQPFMDLIQKRVDAERAARDIQTPIRVVLSGMKGGERGLLGAAARLREPVVPEEPDPLDALALQPPLDVILSDLDETAAKDRNSDIEVRTATLIRRFLRLGGEFGFLSTRDREDIEKRVRVPDILNGLPPAVQQRLKLYDRSGVTHPAVWPLVAGRTNLVSGEHLLQVARSVWPAAAAVPQGQEPTVKDPKNRKHTAYQFGKLTVYVPKSNTPPQGMFAFRHAKDDLGMPQEEIDRELPRLREALVETGLFPQDVDLNFGGSTTINVELAGKGHFIRLAYLENPDYRDKRIGVVDDEGKANTSGRRALEVADPRVVAIQVDRTKDDGTLPARVIRSRRQRQEALNRLLEIENAKREAALREEPAGLEEAGREEIQLPKGAAQGQIFFIGPEVSVPAMWEYWVRLRPAAGEQLQIVIFARDAQSRGAIDDYLYRMERQGTPLALSEPVINLQEEYHGDLEAAMRDRADYYRWQQELEVRPVIHLQDVWELGGWLQIPEASARAWTERVRDQVLQEQL